MKYRYKELRRGIYIVKPSPPYGPAALKFNFQVRKIVIELFGEGGSLNRVCTSVGEPVFQFRTALKDAKRVMKIWRERYGQVAKNGQGRGRLSPE